MGTRQRLIKVRLPAPLATLATAKAREKTNGKLSKTQELGGLLNYDLWALGKLPCG